MKSQYDVKHNTKHDKKSNGNHTNNLAKFTFSTLYLKLSIVYRFLGKRDVKLIYFIRSDRCDALSLSLSHTPTYTLIHTRTLPLLHTHTLPLTLTISLSFSLSLPEYCCIVLYCALSYPKIMSVRTVLSRTYSKNFSLPALCSYCHF